MTTPSPPPSNGNEGGSKPTTTDDSSSMRLTLQVDNTSALPIFLQGRVSNEEKGDTFLCCAGVLACLVFLNKY